MSTLHEIIADELRTGSRRGGVGFPAGSADGVLAAVSAALRENESLLTELGFVQVGYYRTDAPGDYSSTFFTMGVSPERLAEFKLPVVPVFAPAPQRETP